MGWPWLWWKQRPWDCFGPILSATTSSSPTSSAVMDLQSRPTGWAQLVVPMKPITTWTNYNFRITVSRGYLKVDLWEIEQTWKAYDQRQKLWLEKQQEQEFDAQKRNNSSWILVIRRKMKINREKAVNRYLRLFHFWSKRLKATNIMAAGRGYLMKIKEVF